MRLISKHKKKLLFVIGLALIVLAVIRLFDFYADYEKERARWDGLKDAIIAQAEGFNGRAYVVIKDYNRNWRIDIDPGVQVPAASIIKLPIMGAVFSEQEVGRLSVSDKIKLRQKDKIGGSGILKNQRSGKEYNIKEIIELMMTISDNTATNILINLIGFERLNAWFKGNGLKGTYLSRLMMDMASRDKGIENYTTAEDIALVLDLSLIHI